MFKAISKAVEKTVETTVQLPALPLQLGEAAIKGAEKGIDKLTKS